MSKEATRTFQASKNPKSNCMIELHGSGEWYTPTDEIDNGKENLAGVESDERALDLLVSIHLPITAYKLGLNSNNKPIGHRLEPVWDELVTLKEFDGATTAPLFEAEIAKALKNWDVKTFDLLHKWFEKVANFKAAPVKTCMSELSNPNDMPLQDGVTSLVIALEKCIFERNGIPSKIELRKKFNEVYAHVEPEYLAGFDKALRKAGLLWLENATHKH